MPSPREQALKIGIDRSKLDSETEDLPQNTLPQERDYSANPTIRRDGPAEVTKLKES